MHQYRAILVVGYGNMAGAMVDGWLASGVPARTFTAVDPQREAAPDGVRLLKSVPEGEQFDLVLLGVKPQLLGDVAPTIGSLVGPDTVLVSILAGVEYSHLAAHFPKAGSIVRLMPNLAAAIGKSANSLFAADIGHEQKVALTELVSRLGETAWIESEDLMHAVTALAGSGPAFVYRFIDALAASGAELGIDRESAEQLAVQMVEGASVLAARADVPPHELARRVTSRGGTTEAGLEVLDRGEAITELVGDCLRAARDRSIELAENAKKKV